MVLPRTAPIRTSLFARAPESQPSNFSYNPPSPDAVELKREIMYIKSENNTIKRENNNIKMENDNIKMENEILKREIRQLEYRELLRKELQKEVLSIKGPGAAEKRRKMIQEVNDEEEKNNNEAIFGPITAEAYKKGDEGENKRAGGGGKSRRNKRGGGGKSRRNKRGGGGKSRRKTNRTRKRR